MCRRRLPCACQTGCCRGWLVNNSCVMSELVCGEALEEQCAWGAAGATAWRQTGDGPGSLTKHRQRGVGAQHLMCCHVSASGRERHS